MVPDQILSSVSTIAAAYLARNEVSIESVSSLIKGIHATLVGLGDPPPVEKPPAQEPAVAIKKSVTPDFIICLEDGAKLKMLKRYIQSRYGMTPAEYRAKWGLPADYPMVAPNYAQQRSALAKKFGLGVNKAPPAPAAAPAKTRRRSA